MENLIDLELRENLQTQLASNFRDKMGVETLGFIIDWMKGIIVQKNSEFMVTRCCELNHKSSITHRYVKGTHDKVCREYVMRTPLFFIPSTLMMN